ncbi:MAG: methyltransferase domain-containing protein [Gemmatimonadota bacterium]
MPPVPSMLDLVRLSPRRLFPPGGVDLFRQIAVLTEMSEGDEVLGVACGKGVALGYFAEELEVTAAGVEHDPRMVEVAEKWARDGGMAGQLQFQTGRSDALPYRDEIFDISIGEIGLANHCDPADAVRELVRVTKPGGFVVLVQLVWKAPVDEVRQRVLSEHLGARPMMVVEWKRLLREAGVGEVHTENWSDEETSFRGGVVKPFPDFAELFSLPEKLGVLRRAWRRWGWRGVKTVLERESEVHKLLTTERILGLDLLRGRKEPVGPEKRPAGRTVDHEGAKPEERPPTAPTEDSDSTETSVPAAVAALPHPSDVEEERDGDRSEGPEGSDTEGLPLFSGDDPSEGGGRGGRGS